MSRLGLVMVNHKSADLLLVAKQVFVSTQEILKTSTLATIIAHRRTATDFIDLVAFGHILKVPAKVRKQAAKSYTSTGNGLRTCAESADDGRLLLFSASPVQYSIHILVCEGKVACSKHLYEQKRPNKASEEYIRR